MLSRSIGGAAALLVAAIAVLASSVRADDNVSDSVSSAEKELIGILRSAPEAEKAVACKHLAVHGTKAAVPELASLLRNERLASWARIALEAIPGTEADEALRGALGDLHGRQLVGVVNSIGVRGDAQAGNALARLLGNEESDTASSAAVALGRIGTSDATAALRKALTSAPEEVRGAVAEGCILCAERLMKDGYNDKAAEIYDEVRRAAVPRQRQIEATRGAILARGSAGLPLLIEQLRSSDQGLVQIALMTAREIPGDQVAERLAAETAELAPNQAALVLYAVADREDRILRPSVLEIAKSAPGLTRIAAIGVVGRLGDAATVPTLLEIATGDDGEAASAAKAALIELAGHDVDSEIKRRVDHAEGRMLAALIEVAGERRIHHTSPLVKALASRDAEVRRAALGALGLTVGFDELPILIEQVLKPGSQDDAASARQALKLACIRMPDRDACAAEVARAIAKAPGDTKASLVEILGAMQGATSLATIASVIETGDEGLQDVGSRVLGEWMTVDAAPVLLKLAKSDDKFQVRALRGYLRLARQFEMSNEERAEICRNTLGLAKREEERKLALGVLERYPSRETLAVAIDAARISGVHEDAKNVALKIAEKLNLNDDQVKQILERLDEQPAKVEVTSAK
jgi:HEAT repeat protein